MMILDRIYDLASPILAGRRIGEVRVGLNFLGVELDDGSLGLAYVLKEDVVSGCAAIPRAGRLTGMPAAEMASWALERKSVIAVAAGLAVMNAVAEFDDAGQEGDRDEDAAFAVPTGPDDTVGVVGHIGPLIAGLRGKVRRLLVFERGKEAIGDVYPEAAEPQLLPECQVVFVSSTSLINGTLDNLLGYCGKARDIVMVGASTPMYPAAFAGTGVTLLAGTKWLPENRDAILTGISQCAGMKQLIGYGRKVSARV
ncbi:Rossmann-like domain-containing protein [Anaeroselena agilis]|uniref:DUF364 domain-containing protein n=1 Tax=Anaeroselena agilis TaxID=3063788 RepID=A0ABU3NZE3_9FIRM|nr:DUF364 domain-containing protein [Selenomonadales bacterium 4137-cl]